MTMKLQFAHQDYQSKSVNAVVKVFDGQPLAKGDFSPAGLTASVACASDGSIGNGLTLSEEQLLSNVQAVQKAKYLLLSERLIASASDEWGSSQEVFCP